MTKLFVNDLRLALEYPDMFADCISKAATFDAAVTIWPAKPTVAGWLEWGIEIGVRKMFIAAIKRGPNEKTEFCS
jgi:hypothetical protein